ncbi:hypothetical protein TNCT_387781 [Trichonephila clavata]|uniref:Uncharacterized protein n=1 Tax=Trichonephila clavata TaxID=2740835 RepID=A0A8X6LWA2_TRICU|nr:hypothetical protein TNCT_387781 [Trichonephila clavata]
MEYLHDPIGIGRYAEVRIRLVPSIVENSFVVAAIPGCKCCVTDQNSVLEMISKQMVVVSQLKFHILAQNHYFDKVLVQVEMRNFYPVETFEFRDHSFDIRRDQYNSERRVLVIEFSSSSESESATTFWILVHVNGVLI